MDEQLHLDVRALDRARISRDARFDGKFFIGVTSTGVYCRPICPSRTSKPANVRYYATAAAAAEAGFRPCLRCRPEAAPGTPAWIGTCAVVNRALRMINEGALDELSVESLAVRLGVSSRHLHRLFVRHVGASPITVAQTRRLHFAKRLLDETHLPITQIALASGFGSVRRFNDAIRGTYGRAPRDLRARSAAKAMAAGEVVLKLAYRPPYDWQHMVDSLAVTAVSGVEWIEAGCYARTIVTASGAAIVSVSVNANEHALELRVCGAAPSALVQIATAARRVFDLAADSTVIDAALGSDPFLGPLVRRRPGLRIPGAWDPFECAVRSLIAENESPEKAQRLLDDLVARTGEAIDSGHAVLTRTFPSPALLATADLDGLGIPSSKLHALRALALVLSRGDRAQPDSDAVMQAMTQIPEVSDWMLQVFALRSLSEPDAFPAADRFLRNVGTRTASMLSATALLHRAEVWRPWRGYAAMHLWAVTSKRRERAESRHKSRRSSPTTEATADRSAFRVSGRIDAGETDARKDSRRHLSSLSPLHGRRRSRIAPRSV
jgi:AraC family transcriptional regulator of adaptative response / DNA-3-methyladenine glycosylase II